MQYYKKKYYANWMELDLLRFFNALTFKGLWSVKKQKKVLLKN